MSDGIETKSAVPCIIRFEGVRRSTSSQGLILENKLKYNDCSLGYIYCSNFDSE